MYQMFHGQCLARERGVTNQEHDSLTVFLGLDRTTGPQSDSRGRVRVLLGKHPTRESSTGVRFLHRMKNHGERNSNNNKTAAKIQQGGGVVLQVN